MTFMGVRSSDLANQVGRSRKHISEVRSGKSSPPLDEFDKYLEACENLAPGFKKEFARRVAGTDFFCASAEEVISGMSPQEVSSLLFAIAEKVKNRANNYSSTLVG